MSSPADVVSLGRDVDRPRRRLPAGLGVAVVVLLVAGFLLDLWARDREIARLGAEIDRAMAQVVYADRKVAALASYVGPTAGRADLPASTQDSLWAIVGTAAAEGAADVRRSSAAVRGVAVLPWHDDVRQARTAVAARLDITADRMAVRRDQVAAGELRDREYAAEQEARDLMAAAGVR